MLVPLCLYQAFQFEHLHPLPEGLPVAQELAESQSGIPTVSGVASPKDTERRDKCLLPLSHLWWDSSGKHPAVLQMFSKDPVTIATFLFPLFSFISPPSTPRGHFPNTTYTQALDLRSASGTPVSDHHVRAWCQTGSDLGRGEDIFNPTKQNLGPDHRSSLALVPSGQSPFLSLPPGQAG